MLVSAAHPPNAKSPTNPQLVEESSDFQVIRWGRFWSFSPVAGGQLLAFFCPSREAEPTLCCRSRQATSGHVKLRSDAITQAIPLVGPNKKE